MWSPKLCEVDLLSWGILGFFQYFTSHNSISPEVLFNHCRPSVLCHGSLFLIVGATFLSSIWCFLLSTESLQKLLPKGTSHLPAPPGTLEYQSWGPDKQLSSFLWSSNSKSVRGRNYVKQFFRKARKTGKISRKSEGWLFQLHIIQSFT